jgi:class 3 adenylate cyclase
MTDDGGAASHEVPDLRVGDADRQAVVDRLSNACGDGLITLDEFAESAGAAYAAVTRSQLDAVTRDLHLPVLASESVPAPVPQAVPTPAAPPDAQSTAAPTKRRWVVAIMGGEDRRGKWRAGRRTGAFALMGEVELDLRDAVLDGDEIEITAWAIMGGVDVIVPEGIPVECAGFMLMGGRSNRIKDVPPVAGAPVIRVKGYGMWGGINVRSKPPRRDAATARSERDERRRDERLDRNRERLERRRERHGGLGHAPATVPPPASAESAPEAGLVAVVCTDIVGSTRYADLLGDQRWRSVLQAHNTLVREQLARHGGTEIKTNGDGFLVTFPSPRRAVQFAVGVQDALADYRTRHPETPIEVRIGVHAGEVERDGIDVVGRNVTVACRLCDVAAPGEVLASAVVADLSDSASDLSFGTAQEHHLAGIERPVTARPAGHR